MLKIGLWDAVAMEASGTGSGSAAVVEKAIAEAIASAERPDKAAYLVVNGQQQQRPQYCGEHIRQMSMHRLDY
jgi:hypothetical protein